MKNKRDAQCMLKDDCIFFFFCLNAAVVQFVQVFVKWILIQTLYEEIESHG